MPKAREAALKALSLDNQLAESHISLGIILNYYDYDFAGAKREFQRAIEPNPNSAPADEKQVLQTILKKVRQLRLAVDVKCKLTLHVYRLLSSGCAGSRNKLID